MNIGLKLQVPKEHYFINYDTKERWISYRYQVNEVLNKLLCRKEVLKKEPKNSHNNPQVERVERNLFFLRKALPKEEKMACNTFRKMLRR